MPLRRVGARRRAPTPGPTPTSAPTLRLELFGRLGLADDDAAHAELARQPKRAAVLAYLGLMQRHHAARRDVITAMFWPESGQEHARTALRKVLLGLRGIMGEAAIVNHGDEEVALVPALVPCDVTLFRAAIAEGRHEAAMALYRGPLLDGFAAGVPAFEEAARTERRELEELAAYAAWQLADRQERAQDATGATRWARKAVRVGGHDERLLRKVLGLLHRLGDRAGALALYEDFARRMRLDLRAEPSEETQRVVRTLREGID